MAAQVKKYDPNKYNFGDFAKTMNKNFAIERAQNGQGGAFGVNGGVNAANPVNLGGTTNSQTLGNLGQNDAIVGDTVGGTSAINAGGVGNLSGVNTVGQAKPLVGRERFGSITSRFLDVLKAGKEGNGTIYESPLKVGGSEPTPVQKVEADVPEPVDKVPDIYAKMNASGGTKSLDDWIVELSGTYSEDDIRAAYSQHLSAVSQAPIFNGSGEAQLSQGGQATQGGGTLSFEDWQSAYSIDPVVEYQNAQAQLDYEFKTWMSEYGARAEQLYQMGLSNSGVSDIYGANAYTAYMQASMDLKRAEIAQQAENKRAYQEYLDGIEAQQSAVTSAAFNSYAASYTPAQEQSVRVALAAQGLSAEQVESAIAQLNNYYNSLPEDQRPDVVAGNAKVDEAFSWLKVNYTSGMTDEELSAMLGSTYSADVVQKALEKFAPFKLVIDRMLGDEEAKNAFSKMLEMASAGDTDIESLKAKAKGLGYSEDAIAKAAENFQTLIGKTDLTSDIDNADITQISFPNLYGILENARVEHGKDSETFKEIQKSVQNKANEVFQLALNNDYELKRAYSLVGMDFESWSQLSDDAKIEKIMTAVGEYASMDLIDANNASALYDEWFKNELAIMYETINQVGITLGEKYDYLDKIITKVEEYNKAGYLDKEVAGQWLKQLKDIKAEEKEETANTNLRNWAQASQPQPIGSIDYSDVWSIIDAIGKALANSKMS